MASRPMSWKVLQAIADGRGRASKESLAVRAWGASQYHPLRDDKRMQVAVRKLRLVLEDDASKPTRLVTTPEGYAFGEREAVRRSRDASRDPDGG